MKAGVILFAARIVPLWRDSIGELASRLVQWRRYTLHDPTRLLELNLTYAMRRPRRTSPHQWQIYFYGAVAP